MGRLDEVKARHVAFVYRRCGSKKDAAQILGITIPTVDSYLERWNMYKRKKK